MSNTENKLQEKSREVSFILRDLLKVIKVVSTYPEDNPLPQSLRQSFSEKLVSVVGQYGNLSFSIERDHIQFGGEVVYEGTANEDNLAVILFEAGITQLDFLDGIDVGEVYKLLAAVKTYQNTPGKALDLPTLLWEASLSRVTLQTIEDAALGEYDENFQIQEYLERGRKRRASQSVFGTDSPETYAAIFNEGEGDNLADSGRVFSGTVNLDDSGELEVGERMGIGVPVPSGSASPGPPPSDAATGPIEDLPDHLKDAVQMFGGSGSSEPAAESPQSPIADTTIILNSEFTASEQETEHLRALLTRDADFDIYESTLEILKEMLLQEHDMNAFYETVTICEKVLGEFVNQARLTEGSHLLGYMGELSQRLQKDKGLWSERLKDAVTIAGSRDRLAILATALNNHPEIGVSQIKKYLDCFGWESLSSITDLLGTFEHKLHREALKDYLTARGTDNLDIVAKGIFDKRPHVAKNAVSVLGKISDIKSLGYLEKVITHSDLEVRQEVVAALAVSPFARALDLLKQMVDDSDAAIRGAAVEAIVERKGADAFNTIAEVIGEDGFVLLDAKEQEALLVAYSILGGDEAVSYLEELIRRKNLFGDSGLKRYRKMAFVALSNNRGEKAERVLLKLSKSWRSDISRQAGEAIQKRREIMFGGEE